MQEHEIHLKIAQDDLLAAKALLKISLSTTAVFHVQQCFEKSLKGYLAFCKQKSMKTHDLEFLVKECCKLDLEFARFIRSARELKPFVTRGRYADDYMEIEEALVAMFLEQAEMLLRFVQKKC